jgi:hypothetical protein
MPATQTHDFGRGSKPISRGAMDAIIEDHVISSLGCPDDMLQVQVKPVGGDHYRVNVMVGKTAGSARVADSFFLTADVDGNIVACSPKIARLY